MTMLDDFQAPLAYRQRAASLREAALTVPARERSRLLEQAADWEWRAACIEGALNTLSMQTPDQLPLVA
jgi:hypothetical protein